MIIEDSQGGRVNGMKKRKMERKVKAKKVAVRKWDKLRTGINCGNGGGSKVRRKRKNRIGGREVGRRDELMVVIIYNVLKENEIER